MKSYARKELEKETSHVIDRVIREHYSPVVAEKIATELLPTIEKLNSEELNPEGYITEELKQKYATMWGEVNNWQIPFDFRHMEEPSENDTPLKDDPIKTAYWSGICAVLNALLEDGLIPESYAWKANDAAEKKLGEVAAAK